MSTQHLLAALLAVAATTSVAQTSPTPTRKPAVRRPASTAAKSASDTTAGTNTADNPPNVPPVTGTAKPLYTLRYVDIVVGTGPVAEPEKFYTVRYTGWTTDGKKFDLLRRPSREGAFHLSLRSPPRHLWMGQRL